MCANAASTLIHARASIHAYAASIYIRYVHTKQTYISAVGIILNFKNLRSNSLARQTTTYTEKSGMARETTARMPPSQDSV